MQSVAQQLASDILRAIAEDGREHLYVLTVDLFKTVQREDECPNGMRIPGSEAWYFSDKSTAVEILHTAKQWAKNWGTR